MGVLGNTPNTKQLNTIHIVHIVNEIGEEEQNMPRVNQKGATFTQEVQDKLELVRRKNGFRSVAETIEKLGDYVLVQNNGIVNYTLSAEEIQQRIEELEKNGIPLDGVEPGTFFENSQSTLTQYPDLDDRYDLKGLVSMHRRRFGQGEHTDLTNRHVLVAVAC